MLLLLLAWAGYCDAVGACKAAKLLLPLLLLDCLEHSCLLLRLLLVAKSSKNIPNNGIRGDWLFVRLRESSSHSPVSSQP